MRGRRASAATRKGIRPAISGRRSPSRGGWIRSRKSRARGRRYHRRPRIITHGKIDTNARAVQEKKRVDRHQQRHRDYGN